ncbi:MAG: NADPH-dependent 2,4-dienoyl-CoA reductase/sulfur reductase-like enzyme [Patiriisocius sp.]|jgi:NADPH-dependent 2,4-dienoyl-CoA reductase/sulfur reductase-like enzyme
MAHIVIIGNGISGITTARYVRKKSDDRITVISSETDHFYSRTALMYIYMGHMKYEHTKPYEDWFWEKNNIELKRGYVSNIDYDNKKLSFQEGGDMSYDKLVLAVGSKSNKFGWKGQDLDGVQGLYNYQDLELLEKNTNPPNTPEGKGRVKRGVIVGGGLIGVELAEMLHSRNIDVTFLVRENAFWGNVLPAEEGKLVMRHLIEHHVDMRLQSELEEIIPDSEGRVKAIKTKSGDIIDCEFVGLTAGVSPNIDFLKGGKLECNRGILVDRFLQTNIPDVYALGDCAEQRQGIGRRRPLEQVWYTGKNMGMALASTLTGNPVEYNPGNWFNSAKFFDIEYQTYGWVMNMPGEDEDKFYWEDEEGKICLKIIYNKSSKKFIGLNVFGIRIRHEIMDRWLTAGKDVYYILEHLKDANFDPEFYKHYEVEIISKFNRENGTSLSAAKKSWRRIFQKTD